jgi:hypothetical protein
MSDGEEKSRSHEKAWRSSTDSVRARTANAIDTVGGARCARAARGKKQQGLQARACKETPRAISIIAPRERARLRLPA